MKIRFDTPPTTAQESNGLAVRYAAAKREVPRWRWYLMLAVIGLPLVWFAARFAGALVWETTPGFVVLKTVVVRAGSTGIARDVAAAGSTIERGATLLRVEPLPPPAAGPLVAAALGGRGNAPGEGAAGASGTGQRGADLPTDAADASLQLLQRAARLAERTVAFRRERVAAVESLRGDGAATRAESDAARAALVQAEADVLRARSDIEARRTTLAETRRRLMIEAGAAATTAGAAGGVPAIAGDPLAFNLAPVPVSSPMPGTVAGTRIVDGEFVTPLTEVMTLQGHEPALVEAYVPPADARYAQLGRQATLRFFDGARVPAVVAEVTNQAERLPAERVGPLSPRSAAILVRLRTAEPLAPAYRIDGLPLDVRFETVWPWQ